MGHLLNGFTKSRESLGIGRRTCSAGLVVFVGRIVVELLKVAC